LAWWLRCAAAWSASVRHALAARSRPRIAGKNIDELLEDLNRTFHRLRQNGFEELFDVVSGFEALTPKG